MNDIQVMNKAADNIRILAASMVEKANSGHPGGAMGGADFVLRVLNIRSQKSQMGRTRSFLP